MSPTGESNPAIMRRGCRIPPSELSFRISNPIFDSPVAMDSDMSYRVSPFISVSARYPAPHATRHSETIRTALPWFDVILEMEPMRSPKPSSARSLILLMNAGFSPRSGSTDQKSSLRVMFISDAGTVRDDSMTRAVPADMHAPNAANTPSPNRNRVIVQTSRQIEVDSIGLPVILTVSFRAVLLSLQDMSSDL